jgi:signal peptidase I
MRGAAGAVAVAVALILLPGCSDTGGVRVYRVPSSSMEPTLHCARPAPGCEGAAMDRVAVAPYDGRRPVRGDIVVFRTPPAAKLRCGASGVFIKRMIGLPGERWSERRGFVYIDGRRLAEPYLRSARRDFLSFPGGRIPAGRFLLLGDNRASSCDSRIWGLVPLKNVIGHVTDIKRGSRRIHIS